MARHCVCCKKILDDPMGTQKYCNNCVVYHRPYMDKIGRLKNQIKKITQERDVLAYKIYLINNPEKEKEIKEEIK